SPTFCVSGASFGSTGVCDVFAAIVCSESLLRSISSLKAPHREYSGGISVRLIHAPLAYLKKSSPGFTDGSTFFGSSGGAFCALWGCTLARNPTAQAREIIMGMNDFIILEKKRFRIVQWGLDLTHALPLKQRR